MSLSAIQSADIEKIQADLGNPQFTWGIVSYDCIPSGYSRDLRLEEGGLDIEADLVLKVLTSQFNSGLGPFPNETEKNKVTYQGRTYKIQTVIWNETRTFLKLVCKSATDGA
jgi:hypothetical protein